jgi:hypothetical protein
MGYIGTFLMRVYVYIYSYIYIDNIHTYIYMGHNQDNILHGISYSNQCDLTNISPKQFQKRQDG